MKSTEKTEPAEKDKTEGLAILESGEQVIVSKRRKPVARVVLIETGRAVSLAGSVTFHGDIVGPTLDAWDIDP